MVYQQNYQSRVLQLTYATTGSRQHEFEILAVAYAAFLILHAQIKLIVSLESKIILQNILISAYVIIRKDNWLKKVFANKAYLCVMLHKFIEYGLTRGNIFSQVVKLATTILICPHQVSSQGPHHHR